jgi:hypothetical protein
VRGQAWSQGLRCDTSAMPVLARSCQDTLGALSAAAMLAVLSIHCGLYGSNPTSAAIPVDAEGHVSERSGTGFDTVAVNRGGHSSALFTLRASLPTEPRCPREDR